MHIIEIGTRYAVVELDNLLPYYTEETMEVFVNENFYAKSNKNVIGIYDLEPNQKYNIKVGNEAVQFVTKEEVICLHTNLFNPAKDGTTDDTLKLQAAILCCPEGGTVYVDEGLYLMTCLFLKSNINLYFAKGAKFICQYDRNKFPVLPGLINNGVKELNLGSFEGSETDVFASIITGINIENVTIGGQGEIDGQAILGDWYKNHNEKRIAYRPFGIYFNRCENVSVAGLYIHDTACWNIHPYFSNNLNFLDLRIENPTGMPTTDGIDPDCCNNVLILGVSFNVGDDCIAIKSGTIDFAKKYLRPTSTLTIRNCLMQKGHGAVVFGSEASGGINDIIVSQCYFQNTDRGLRIKTRRGRGRYGKIENITFKNIIMDKVATPFVINMFYNMGPKGGHEPFVWAKEKQPVDITTPYIGHFTFNDIKCKDVSLAAGVFLGLPEEPIKSLTFDNVEFSYDLNAKPGYPVMIEHKDEMCRVGLYLDNVDRLVLRNVIFSGNLGEEVVTNGKTIIENI